MNPEQSRETDLEKCGVRYDLLRILYAGMLLNFSTDEIRRFWRKNPLPGMCSFDEYATFDELWQGHKWYPQQFVFSVLDSLEPELLPDGGIFDFISNSFHRINKGLLIPPRDWLAWSKPVFGVFFKELDIRELVLKVLQNYTSMIKPGLQYNVVNHVSKDNKNRTTMIVAPSSPCFPLPKYDCELWGATLIRGVPGALNLEPFESQFMLADHREISSILKTGCTVNGDFFYYNDEPIAKKTSFNKFCQQNELDLSSYAINDCTVWVVSEDIVCPRRKRVILHKNCAYGAPVYLFGYEYTHHTRAPSDFMSSLIDDIAYSNDDIWVEIKKLHHKLMEPLIAKAVFVYDRKHETIQLNGDYILRSVPAKILRKMLSIYKESGRTEFQHAEFVKDETIIDNPFSPNFVVRLQRLTQTLQNSKEISILKIDKGRFAIQPKCKIEFYECN